MAVRPRTRHRRASEPQERSPKLPLWKVRPWMAVVEWHGPRSNISHRGRFAQPSGMMAKKWSRPVSRVLCALRRDSHSSRPSVTAWLKQPTRERRGPRHRSPIWSCSGWGLPCRSVARLAVGSYPTVSPLPAFRLRRSTLCCTFRRLAPPRRYLAPCPVEPGLSSAFRRMTRLSGRLHGRFYQPPYKSLRGAPLIVAASFAACAGGSSARNTA